MQFKKSVIALAMIAVASTLAGCDDESDSAYESRFKSNVVAQASMDQSNIEKDAAYQLTRALRASDPKIEAVEPTIESGRRTLMISRARDDGSFETWTMNPNQYEELMRDAQAKTNTPVTKSESGFDMGSAMTGALVGAMVGGLATHMFHSSSGATSNYPTRTAYNAGLQSTRQRFANDMSSYQSRQYDREREKERRGGGYVSPFIGQAATSYAAASGQRGYSYSGVSHGSPSSTSARAAAGRSSSSGQAFSSGARGSVSSGG